jgi:hypothetical protein
VRRFHLLIPKEEEAGECLDKTELYVLETLNVIHKVLEEDLNIKIL